MYQHHRGRSHAPIWAVMLAATFGMVSSSETANTSPSGDEAAAQHLVDALLNPNLPKHRPPLISDADHARTIDPVLTRNTAVWIHETLPAGPLTVMGGKVFSYSDVAYNPLDAPVLKIRPIDDEQVIPFLLRIVVFPDGQISSDGAVVVSFPAPPIFNPGVGRVSAWVGSRPAEVGVDASPEGARINLRVPLDGSEFNKREEKGEPISLIIEGELELGAYRTLSPGRFLKDSVAPADPAIAGLSKLEIGREVSREAQREALVELAEEIISRSTSTWETVVAINKWVSSNLRYQESHATRSVPESLEDRSGDCDEHTALMVALLRASGVTARQATGLLYDLDTFAAHAWVEAALPIREGKLHWFICDPTLAGTTPVADRKAAYVQLKERILLYPMRPVVGVEGFTGRRINDFFLNWRKPGVEPLSIPGDLNQFIDLVTAEVDKEILLGAERLAEAGLTLRRESASITGSPYLLVNRPLAGEETSHLQMRLENEERLVLEVVADDGAALESASALEAVSHLRDAYEVLNARYFPGAPAHANLELVFIRDRHNDRLHTVSLRIGRYLAEHSLARVLGKLVKHELLTTEETTPILEIAELCDGKNLYFLQELARRHLPTTD